jgi:hypothetical protein
MLVSLDNLLTADSLHWWMAVGLPAPRTHPRSPGARQVLAIMRIDDSHQVAPSRAGT